MKVETKAMARSVRMSPRKVRLVVDLIRGKSAGEAATQLRLLKSWAAKPVAKLLQSAVANAKHNHEIKEETLRVVRAAVDGGMVVKRFMPRAMGRGVPIRHRTSHITIVLSGDAPEKKVKKTEEKKVEKSDEENPKVQAPKTKQIRNKKTKN